MYLHTCKCRCLQFGNLVGNRKIKKIIGESPNSFINNFRIEKSVSFIEKNTLTISEIAYKCGFDSPSYFTKRFVEKYKLPPSLYKASLKK